jgi:sphingolipid delta-4 desaturase
MPEKDSKVTKRDDYYWVDYPEPHAERKIKILEKHPEIAELYGYDPKTKFVMMFWMVVQFSIAIALRNYSWPVIIGIAWAFGAIAGQAMVLGLHETSRTTPIL